MTAPDGSSQITEYAPIDRPRTLEAKLQIGVAALRSALAYLVISLYLLIVGLPGTLLAALFSWKSLVYTLGHGGIELALAATGIRYRVAGREHLPRGRAAVYCCNHESNVDFPVLFRVLHPRLHALYKAEFGKVPVLGRAVEIGGFVAVDRYDREQSTAAIERAAQSLRDGNSFMIFPEGTRSRSGTLLPFKKGGFIMAIKAQAPVVPVAVQGGRASMRKGSAIIRPATVSVRIGRPIETAGLTLNDRDLIIAETRAQIERLLAEGPIRG